MGNEHVQCSDRRISNLNAFSMHHLAHHFIKNTSTVRMFGVSRARVCHVAASRSDQILEILPHTSNDACIHLPVSM